MLPKFDNTKICGVVNLTPHSVLILDDNGDVLDTFSASGDVARIDEDVRWLNDHPVWSLRDIPFATVNVGKVNNLPDASFGNFFIVSRMVFDALSDRDDLIVPFDVVRDDDGNIIGCKGFLTRSEKDERGQ
jgi:hypothetical protein